MESNNNTNEHKYIESDAITSHENPKINEKLKSTSFVSNDVMNGNFNICGLMNGRFNMGENIGNLNWDCFRSPSCNDNKFVNHSMRSTVLHQLLLSFDKNDENLESLNSRIESNMEEIKIYDEKYETPLICACKMKNLPAEVIKKMLENSPSAASIPDSNGSYPLHHYAASEKVENSIIHQLVACFPNALLYPNCFGGTPLTIAITSDAIKDDNASSKSYDNVIKMLIKANPKVVRMKNRKGNFPLHYVGRSSKINTRTVEILISLCPEALCKQNVHGATPMYCAVYWGAPFETIKTLLEAAPHAVNIQDDKGLSSVSLAWNLFVCKTKRNADHDNNNKYLENDSVMDDADCDEDNDDQKVSGNREIMLKAETPFDLEGEVESWWEKMELLLRASYHNSVLELPQPKVWRILHAVVGVNCPPNLARFTIKLYRNHVFLKDEEGKLPLHIAARTPIYIPQWFEPQNNHAPVLVVLAHINPNGLKEKDINGQTALHIALEAGKTWGEGISKLPHYFPDIVRKRDPFTKLYPFMMSAVNFMSPSQLFKKCESIAKSKVTLKQWKSFSQKNMDRQIEQIKKVYEVEKFNTIYNLLRIAPDVLTRAVKGYSDDKEKVWLRQSNAKLHEQISEMKPASTKLKQVIKKRKKLYASEIENLKLEIHRLRIIAHR